MNSNSETKTGGRPQSVAPFSPLSPLEEQAASELRGRGAPWEVIAAILGRSKYLLRRAAGVVPASVQEAPLLDAADYAKMPGRRPWTDAEDTLLAEAYGPDAPKPVSTGDICRRLHRPVQSVCRRAAILGLSRKENGRKTKAAARAGSACRPWTQDEDALLAELWPDNGVLAVSRALGREPEDVRRRAARVVRGASRPVRADGDWWTSDEDEAIRLLYPLIGAATLAVWMGRTVEAVKKRAAVVLQGIEDSKRISAYRIMRQWDEKFEEKNYFLKKLAESTETWAFDENS